MKSRVIRGASERCVFRVPYKLACGGIRKRIASTGLLGVALLTIRVYPCHPWFSIILPSMILPICCLCPFRVYWCDWWFPIILLRMILSSMILSISALLRPLNGHQIPDRNFDQISFAVLFEKSPRSAWSKRLRRNSPSLDSRSSSNRR